MNRKICVAAAQMGPIARDEPRESAVSRMMTMMREAHGRGARLVVFPELALTTFFPRWWMEDEAELDTFYEEDMPSAAAAPLFELGRKLGVGFYLGYAEIVREGNRKRRFNTSILVDQAGRVAGKYRKVHLPGHANHEPDWPFQHLEKAYFEPGDLGFPVFDAFDGRVGMCICNDRRWPETYRVMGLEGVEIVLLGYNTPVHYPRAPAARPSPELPQPPVHAGRRLPERNLGGGGREGGTGGRVRPHRPELHHRADRRDRRDVHDAR